MTDSAAPTRRLSDPNSVPVTALQLATRNLISSALNALKVIPNDNGLPRDWRGLAHLVGLKVEKIPVISCDPDPTARVLTLWQKQENSLCTIKQLQDLLGELDRYDVVDDTAAMIAKDISHFMNEPEKVHNCTPPPMNEEVDRHILTIDDVCRIDQGLGTQNYDAFVVFADEDIDFATKLIEIMENQYGLKLCVKERDLVAGLPFEHKAIIELISERCHRLIVIISPAYLKSAANKFVVNYAQALGIEQGNRKIIPCLYEQCDLPNELRHTFMLSYPRSGKLFNFWEKLHDSIQVPSVQSSPKIKVNRPASQEIQSYQTQTLPIVKPALAQNKEHSKHSVRFGSLTNLAIAEISESQRSISENALNSDSSATSTNSSIKEHKKPKFHIFKKLLNHKDEKKKKKNKHNNDVDNDKKKAPFWKNKFKRCKSSVKSKCAFFNIV